MPEIQSKIKEFFKPVPGINFFYFKKKFPVFPKSIFHDCFGFLILHLYRRHSGLLFPLLRFELHKVLLHQIRVLIPLSNG